LRFENVTLHVDREQFDQRLFQAAVDAGVEYVWERVHTVELVDDRVMSCSTASRTSHEADWYVNASGRSRLIGRAAHIGTRRWGLQRIGIWTRRASPTPVEGTVLHLDDTADDLVWAWQIPIGRDRTSVGVVLPLDEFKTLRREEASVDRVFSRALGHLPNLEPPASPGPVMTRVYQPHVSERVVGPNWMMVGEAACLIDPLSSMGVTAALRHGTEAAKIIAESLRHPDAAHRLLSGYDQRVRGIAVLYNDALDTLLYRASLRRRLGIKQAARAYVILGYLANALYTRLKPDNSRMRHAAMTLVLGFFRAWTRSWWAASRAAR
jgi:flavin-dependent dehydrogenase